MYLYQININYIYMRYAIYPEKLVYLMMDWIYAEILFTDLFVTNGTLFGAILFFVGTHAMEEISKSNSFFFR